MSYEQLVRDLDEDGRVRLYRALERAGVGTYKTWQHMLLTREPVDVGRHQTIFVSILKSLDGAISWRGYIDANSRESQIVRELERDGWEVTGALPESGKFVLKRRVSEEGRSVFSTRERLDKLITPEPKEDSTSNGITVEDTMKDLQEIWGNPFDST